MKKTKLVSDQVYSYANKISKLKSIIKPSVLEAALDVIIAYEAKNELSIDTISKVAFAYDTIKAV